MPAASHERLPREGLTFVIGCDQWSCSGMNGEGGEAMPNLDEPALSRCVIRHGC